MIAAFKIFVIFYNYAGAYVVTVTYACLVILLKAVGTQLHYTYLG